MTDMTNYIGTKLISARPMGRREYNVYRGWELPPNENGDDEGYLVEYKDGGPPNDPRHEGYISWLPKAVFELAYYPFTCMTWSQTPAGAARYRPDLEQEAMSGQYEDYLEHVMAYGVDKADRTGTGTRSVFGYQMRFDLSQGFPLVTTKKVHFKSVAIELLWFLRGETNVRWLQERGVTIWDEWADEDGELGPVYGKQWRDFGGVDQIAKAIETLKKNPDSRRILVSAWNPPELPDMALEPCHVLFQFYVANGKLSCQVYQRSCDSFLGVPFNIASYALLTHLVAHQCDLDVGELIWVGGDCHIYNNHVEQVREQLTREPRPFPKLVIKRRPPEIHQYEFEDFELVGYDPHPAIKAPVAV